MLIDIQINSIKTKLNFLPTFDCALNIKKFHNNFMIDIAVFFTSKYYIKYQVKINSTLSFIPNGPKQFVVKITSFTGIQNEMTHSDNASLKSVTFQKCVYILEK